MSISHKGYANRTGIHPTPQLNTRVDITAGLNSRYDHAASAGGHPVDMLMEPDLS